MPVNRSTFVRHAISHLKNALDNMLSNARFVVTLNNLQWLSIAKRLKSFKSSTPWVYNSLAVNTRIVVPRMFLLLPENCIRPLFCCCFYYCWRINFFARRLFNRYFVCLCLIRQPHTRRWFLQHSFSAVSTFNSHLFTKRLFAHTYTVIMSIGRQSMVIKIAHNMLQKGNQKF